MAWARPFPSLCIPLGIPGQKGLELKLAQSETETEPETELSKLELA